MSTLSCLAAPSPRTALRDLEQRPHSLSDFHTAYASRVDALENVMRTGALLKVCLRDIPPRCTCWALKSPFSATELSELERAYAKQLGRHVSLCEFEWLDSGGERPDHPMLASSTLDPYDADWDDVENHVVLLWLMSGFDEDIDNNVPDWRTRVGYVWPELPDGHFDGQRFAQAVRRRAIQKGASEGWAVLPACLRWAAKATGNPLIDAVFDDNGAFGDWRSDFNFTRRSLRCARTLTREVARYERALATFARWLKQPGNATELLTLWRDCHRAA